MQVVMIVLLFLALAYLLTLATVFLISAFILRHKLRKYQEDGRFGY